MTKYITMNDGHKIPIIGLGTWGSPQGQVEAAVKYAIDVGYRHIDCAHVYQNEVEVGNGIKSKIADGTIKREDLFVTSKLWNTFHRPDLVQGALMKTLADLNLEYLDLYLIHWPMGYKEGDELFPIEVDDSIAFSPVDYVDTWLEMEKLVETGKVKSIGLSNFNKNQIDRVLEAATIKPAVLQIECHPYLTQTKLLSYCNLKNITVTAYSPLGSPNRPWAKPGDPSLLEDPKIIEIAKKYERTPAQLLIRYQIEKGNVVIPKSVTPERISSNFDVFSFEITEADMAKIDSFNCNGRFVPMTSGYGHPYHPFENSEY